MGMIYLNDAIEAIASRDETDGTYNVFSGKQVIDILKGLPSAEPKTPSNGSITCVKSEKMHDRTTDGLISREDVCEAVKNEMESWLEGDRCDYRNVVDAIMDLPSAQPEIIRCGQCKYAEVADSEDNQDGYTCQFHRGSIWFSGSYCSWAERRHDE